MNIFISHTQKDKPLVEPIAEKLGSVFGKDNIFYDSWSIQPGDGIIDKMNQGIASFKFFFFFVSKNSLSSRMVDLEWQNALLKATKEDVKIIPVKIDDCQMPPILSQNLYIDFINYGPDEALRQMIDVINGERTHRPMVAEEFHNVKAYFTVQDDYSVRIEFRAGYYMEPHSRYLILLSNNESDIEYKAIDESMFESNFVKDFQLDDGRKFNAILIARDTPTSPGFPFYVEVKTKNNILLNIAGVMRATSRTTFKGIPTVINHPDFKGF